LPATKPYSLAHTLVHPLARMTRLLHPQTQVYRLGEKSPPSGGMAEHAPSWEVVSLVLDPLGTLQARVNLQRDFWLLALATSATTITAAGGFRAQLYDTIKKVRLADRGILKHLLGGNGSAPFFLREPYQFDQPNSQLLVTVQNMEAVQNTVQIALYGQVLRFNQ
jgi:hypothetical protein